MTTVAEYMDAMAERFNAEAAAGVDAVFQYHITGDNGGYWFAVIKDSKIDFSDGQHTDPDLTVTMSDDDYIEMAEGRLNGQMAFMTGKLTVKGDMKLAMKLYQIFPTG